MTIRPLGVMGAALAVLGLATWAVGCGGQSAMVDSPEAGVVDADVSDVIFIDSGPPSSDAGNACPPHQVACNGICEDTRFDPSACGSCSNACGPGEVCASGACTSTCPTSQAACKDEDGGLRCADALTDNANCGFCGNVCQSGTICSNGKCSLTCGADETRCTAGDGTKFCTNLQNDPDDCNACGNACPQGTNVASTFCTAGQCGITCTGDTSDCNGNVADGCEVEAMNDSANCGTCGHICPVGGSCGGGTCSCGTRYDQPTEDCGGLCTDTRSDPTNCGGCNTRCTSSSTYESTACVESVCQYSYRSATAPGGVSSIAIDDTYVYYVQGYTGIERVTKASHGETPVSIVADTTAFGVAVDATTIYWTNAYGVFSCPLSGCAGSPKALSDVPSSYSRIVLDDTNFYWTLSGNAGIDKCLKTGCQDAPTRMTSQNTIEIAPGPSSLFVIYEIPPYSLSSITLTAPPTSTVVSTSIEPSSGVAYHAGKIYWENGSSVLTCDPTACVPTALASMATFEFSTYGGPMIADDVALVWAADGIHETSLATGIDSVIANASQGATQLAIDAANAYWASGDGVYWAPR